MRWPIALLAILAMYGIAIGTPARSGRVSTSARPGGDGSPTCVGCGGGVTTTTLPPAVRVPAAGLSDVNCPTTIPALSTAATGFNGYLNSVRTCATGANAGGYDVQSISMYVGTATAGSHIKCSVYSGGAAPPLTQISSGCDSVEATLTLNPTAYVTMATSGSCHLAASTRYWITCNADSAIQWGEQTAACAACWTWFAQTYATAFPASIPAGGTYSLTPLYYLTAQ